MAGRFLSNRDINNGIDRFNKELLESVVGQSCILYKLSVNEIETNVYGETTKGILQRLLSLRFFN